MPSPQVRVVLDDDLRAKLDALAKAHKLSLSATVRFLLASYFDLQAQSQQSTNHPV